MSHKPTSYTNPRAWLPVELVNSPPLQAMREAYAHTRVIANRKVGIQPFLTTVGVVVDINEHGHAYRYCFKEHADAMAALAEWSGVDPMPGPWLKVKGSYRGRTLDHKRGDPHFEARCAEWRLAGKRVRVRVQVPGGMGWVRLEVAYIEVSHEDNSLWAIAGKGGMIVMINAADINTQVIIEN